MKIIGNNFCNRADTKIDDRVAFIYLNFISKPIPYTIKESIDNYVNSTVISGFKFFTTNQGIDVEDTIRYLDFLNKYHTKL